MRNLYYKRTSTITIAHQCRLIQLISEFPPIGMISLLEYAKLNQFNSNIKRLGIDEYIDLCKWVTYMYIYNLKKGILVNSCCLYCHIIKGINLLFTCKYISETNSLTISLLAVMQTFNTRYRNHILLLLNMVTPSSYFIIKFTYTFILIEKYFIDQE